MRARASCSAEEGQRDRARPSRSHSDTDLRLARYFGLSEGFFLGLQADFELMEQKRRLGDELLKITPRAA